MAKTAGLRACTSGPVPKALAQLNAVEGCLGEPIEASGHLMFISSLVSLDLSDQSEPGCPLLALN